MNVRIAKKLRKEMLSWTRDSVPRHKLETFKKAWAIELKAAFAGERWAIPNAYKYRF